MPRTDNDTQGSDRTGTPPARAPGITLRETESVRVAWFTAPPDHVVADHAHDTVHACWIMDGTASERRAGGRESCQPGTLRVSPAGSDHDIRYGPHGARVLILHVPNDALGAAGRRIRETRFRHSHGLDGLLDRLGSRAGWHADPLQRELDVFELFAALARLDSRRKQHRPPPWLLRVRDYLHAHSHRSLQLADLAAVGPSHPTHLAQAFRQHFGVPPGAYLRRLRLSAARRAVLDSDRPLSAIAQDCGFSDHAHMTRLFRRHLGQAPRAVRAGGVDDGEGLPPTP